MGPEEKILVAKHALLEPVALMEKRLGVGAVIRRRRILRSP